MRLVLNEPIEAVGNGFCHVAIEPAIEFCLSALRFDDWFFRISRLRKVELGTIRDLAGRRVLQQLAATHEIVVVPSACEVRVLVLRVRL